MQLHKFENIGKTNILDLRFHKSTIYFVDERDCGLGIIELNKAIEMEEYQKAGKI